MRVLVACEFSGVVRDAFIRHGHDAVSCDLIPTESPGPHIQGDVLGVLNQGWDMMIAHPPCTRLCNSGVRWLHERGLWVEMFDAALFFKRLLAAPIRRIAIENPVMHRYAREVIGHGPDFTIQPWQFGHGEVKRTCFWTKNLPALQPTQIVEGRDGRIWKMGPSASRGQDRSRTYPGIAEAMAEQWGGVTGQEPCQDQ